MNTIECIDICKSYGKKEIVKNLSLLINEGEKLILLGPSGCGKTTTLRMIAGLEDITSGVLRMAGQEVNQVEAGKRNVAMVFQNYALLPHLTVWDNIVFGLKIRKLGQKEIEKRAQEALDVLNLSAYRDAYPKALSGGQKQRVALGRAIVKQSPYFLLDEPLSNLDAKLRYQARTELLRLHSLYKPTMVYVTHDQVEAMALADRIVVLNDGRIQQLGSPTSVYNHPANTFVATFIGNPAMNLLEVTYEDHYVWVGPQKLRLPDYLCEIVDGKEKLWLGIRPEHCYPVYEEETDTAVLQDKQQTRLTGTIENVENLGNQKMVHLTFVDGQNLILSLNPDDAPSPIIGLDWSKVNLFDFETGLNLL